MISQAINYPSSVIDPSPDEIRQRAAKIRRDWSPAQREFRDQRANCRVEWEIPVCSIEIESRHIVDDTTHADNPYWMHEGLELRQ